MSYFSLMRVIVALEILLFVFSSCKKPKVAEPQTAFSFKANGVFYKWSNKISSSTEPQGAILSKLTTGTGSAYYVLEGLDRSSDTYLNLAMFTNTLQATTYTSITSDPNIIFYSVYKFNNAYCAPLSSGDSVSVTISNITNNFATGTFSALMHDLSTKAKIEITEGSFQHVMVVQ
jgi:hypothetical protein